MATKAMVGDLMQKQSANAQRSGQAASKPVSSAAAIPDVQGNQQTQPRPGINMKKVAIVGIIVAAILYVGYRKFVK